RMVVGAGDSECVIARAGGKGEDGQGRVLRALRWETSAVGKVEPMRFPALVVSVKYRALGIVAHPRGTAFVVGATRRCRGLVDPGERHAGHLSERAQGRGLLARADQLRMVMSAIDPQDRDAPCVSQLGV